MTSRSRDEAGMVTAEIAVALPVLVLTLTLVLSAVGAVTDQLRCVDAARTAARLVARGEPVEQVRREVADQAPDGATIDVRVQPDDITVTVAARGPELLAALGVDATPRAIARASPEEATP